MKNVKGRATRDETLCFSLSQRQQVLDRVFAFLLEPRKCDALVAGDLGVGLPTLHNRMQSMGVEKVLETHCIANQTFHTLFHNGTQKNKCTTISPDKCNSRMLIHEIKASSGDRHPTAEPLPVLQEVSSGDGHPTT